VTSRTCPLGTFQAVTGVTGEPFVAFTPAAGRNGMLGLSPDQIRESAEALLAVASEARAVLARPVQDTLFEAGTAA
jgi:hypothetical protein